MKNFFLFIISFFVLSYTVLAYQVSEDIFIDVPEDAPYASQLQYFYDKWIITPNVENKFLPNNLLTRDEAIGIVEEVGCTACITPTTNTELVQNFSGIQDFYDVDSWNQYFYCIAQAKKDNIFSVYTPWYQCQDGSFEQNKSPFCPNDSITREEAISLLLQQSSIFTAVQNTNIMSAIQRWEITRALSKDVTASVNNQANYYYGYLEKALNTSLTEYDILGNTLTYNMLLPDGNENLNPKTYITREEFVKMAYIISKLNACTPQWERQSTQWLQIVLRPSTCLSTDISCSATWVTMWENTYDFTSEWTSTCQAWIQSYTWMFYNMLTHASFTKTWKYLDNITFPSQWQWQVYLTTRDNCWWTSQSQIMLDNSLNVFSQIKASKLEWIAPLEVEFLLETSCQNCTYEWNFGDGSISNNKNPTYIFQQNGAYNVRVTGKTSTQEIAFQNFVTIYVADDVYQTQTGGTLGADRDGDGVVDSADACISIAGSPDNTWCPILNQVCIPNSVTATCPTGYSCGSNWFCSLIPQTSSSDCGPNMSSSVFWNVMCNSCPCDYGLDFLSTFRKCDIIVPAIVSPDGTEIYWKWNGYQIPATYQ